MTTLTRQSTWEELRQWTRTASEDEVRAALRGLHLSVNGNADQRRTRLLGFIGQHEDLEETSTWTPPGWRPAEVHAEEIPAAEPVRETTARSPRETTRVVEEEEHVTPRYDIRDRRPAPARNDYGLPLLGLLAAVLVIAVALSIWRPWESGKGTQVPTTSSTPAAKSENQQLMDKAVNGDSNAQLQLMAKAQTQPTREALQQAFKSKDPADQKKALDMLQAETGSSGTTTGQPQGTTASKTGTVPALPSDGSHGNWKVSTTSDLGKTDPVISGWISRLKDPAPTRWKTFPNVPNPDVSDFRVSGKQVPDGMEYGTYSTPYCWQSPCDIPVGAWEYRYISGDYDFQGMTCKADGAKGCMLLLVNEGDQSFTWRNQYVDNGFTLRGRYFNGDALEWGVWGLVSHGSANMLNLPTNAHPDEVLNSGSPGNSGANCGTPAGCKSVDVTIVVQTGSQIKAILKSTVTR